MPRPWVPPAIRLGVPATRPRTRVPRRGEAATLASPPHSAPTVRRRSSSSAGRRGLVAARRATWQVQPFWSYAEHSQSAASAVGEPPVTESSDLPHSWRRRRGDRPANTRLRAGGGFACGEPLPRRRARRRRLRARPRRVGWSAAALAARRASFVCPSPPRPAQTRPPTLYRALGKANELLGLKSGPTD